VKTHGPVGSAGDGARGFTLIEVLITVAIVAVLMAIALPSYRDFVLRANRADAKAVLMETSQFMERYFTTNNTYVASPVLTPLSLVSPKGATGIDVRYNISFASTAAGTAAANPTATTYFVRAVPVNGQSGDSCGTLTISNTGAQYPATAGCW